MANHNELTAIKSAGIGLPRILVPLFVCSIVVSLLALGFAENVVPVANQEKTKIEDEHLTIFKRHSKTRLTNIFWRDKIGRRIFIGDFNVISNSANTVSIQKVVDNQVVERLDALSMKWQDSTWVLYNGYKRTFSEDAETAEPFERLEDEFLNVKPNELQKYHTKPEDMSYRELRSFIQEVQRNGGNAKRWLVDLHFKLSIPFGNFIMVLFGAPLAAVRKRGSAVFSLIVSILICLIYYGTTKVVQALGQNGVMPAAFAAWVTNLFFLIAGLGILFLGRK